MKSADPRTVPTLPVVDECPECDGARFVAVGGTYERCPVCKHGREASDMRQEER